MHDTYACAHFFTSHYEHHGNHMYLQGLESGKKGKGSAKEGKGSAKKS